MEALFLFLILVLGILLASFLPNNNSSWMEAFTLSDISGNISDISGIYADMSGTLKTNYDNYNHYQGSSVTLTNGEIFYGPNGTAVVTVNSDGSQSLAITTKTSMSPVVLTTSGTSSSFQGSGYKAIIISHNGHHALLITSPEDSNIYTTTPNNATSTEYYGATGSVPPYQNAYSNTTSSYPTSTTSAYPSQPSSNLYLISPWSPWSSSPTATSSTATSSTATSSTTDGIPKSQIPPGQEDLYILKSAIITPGIPSSTCPVCQQSSTSSGTSSSKCPPCPACARCPEQNNFECKKVPNYNSISDNALPSWPGSSSGYQPTPYVNSFSSF